jgi:hypothetical protein
MDIAALAKEIVRIENENSLKENLISKLTNLVKHSQNLDKQLEEINKEAFFITPLASLEEILNTNKPKEVETNNVKISNQEISNEISNPTKEIKRRKAPIFDNGNHQFRAYIRFNKANDAAIYGIALYKSSGDDELPRRTIDLKANTAKYNFAINELWTADLIKVANNERSDFRLLYENKEYKTYESIINVGTADFSFEKGGAISSVSNIVI